jgi:VanZ family protein
MRPLTKISLFGVRLATCVLALYWVSMFTGTHLPQIPNFSPKLSDKELHFGAFFGLTILLCWVIQTRTTAAKKFAKVLVIAISYAAIDEITQGFVSGRTPDLYDFAADSCGVLSAIAFYALMRILLPRLTTPVVLS